MIRTQVRLHPDQHERLKVLAARRSTSLSQLVREGVAHVLATEHREATWDRFLNAAGSCRTKDGATDISSRHDANLSDAFPQEGVKMAAMAVGVLDDPAEIATSCEVLAGDVLGKMGR